MSLIGKKAPEFTATAVLRDQILNDFSLSEYLGKYVVLFFYPLDFTFVCPTELHAFQDHLEKFEERNVQVVGCSIDSIYSHLAWLKIPKKEGGIQGIAYPIISDIQKSIARDFDVLNEKEGIAYRGLFVMDKEGIIRHGLINDLPIGRSVEEVLRVVDALIFHENHGEVCPANWRKGTKAMKPTDAGVVEFFSHAHG